MIGNLIAVYDDNKITIDGDTNVSFTENVEERFKSYGWNVLHVEKGDDDFAAIEGALAEAKKATDAPTIINLKTTIGYGSLKAGGHDVHGARKFSVDVTNNSPQKGRHRPAQKGIRLQPRRDLCRSPRDNRPIRQARFGRQQARTGMDPALQVVR